MSPVLRTILALLGVSAWMALLMAGATLGGAVYLLLPASIGIFPWRALADGSSSPDPPDGA